MPERRLPVRPNFTQLKNQAKDLLLQFREGNPAAVEEFRKHHPEKITSAEAKLADAQLVPARSYQASGWTRLVLACKLIDGIRRDDLDTVRSIIEKNPRLLHENAGIRNSNWGPPMSYAANLGRDAIIRMLYEHGARDLQHAIGRATLQGKIETASMLYAHNRRRGLMGLAARCSPVSSFRVVRHTDCNLREARNAVWWQVFS